MNSVSLQHLFNGSIQYGFFCYYIHFFHIWYSQTGEKRCYEIMVVTNSNKTFGMSKPLSIWKNPISFHYFIDNRFYTFPTCATKRIMSHSGGPCQNLHCHNGGRCEAKTSRLSTCICPIGYSGTDCKKSKTRS